VIFVVGSAARDAPGVMLDLVGEALDLLIEQFECELAIEHGYAAFR
jgi:hypothetical protein